MEQHNDIIQYGFNHVGYDMINYVYGGGQQKKRQYNIHIWISNILY